MASRNGLTTTTARARICRWVFYFSLAQVLLFFAVPALQFPARYLFHIEALAALTLGLIPALYLFLASLCGLFMDRAARALYLSALVVTGLWFVWAGVSWTYIEYMDYLRQ
jgi:hypothetical protein